MQLRKNKRPEYSDEKLLQRFQETTDLKVLGVLYDRYVPLVYGVCLKYLKNREDSQDAVMQIFELLVEKVPKHEIQVFKSWLYGVTRNFCLMQLRSSKAQKAKKILPFVDDFMESSHEMHPIDIEAPKEVSATLKHCMDTLKAQQKQCVELFYYEELCYREIAKSLKIEEKKVKSFIQNGKRNLKICLERKAKKTP